MCCLEAFGRECKVTIQLIDDVIGVLSDELFTPDSLTEVSIERLCELLPNFAEGQLYSLKSFTGHWFDKVSSKHAHHLKFCLVSLYLRYLTPWNFLILPL